MLEIFPNKPGNPDTTNSCPGLFELFRNRANRLNRESNGEKNQISTYKSPKAPPKMAPSSTKVSEEAMEGYDSMDDFKIPKKSGSKIESRMASILENFESPKLTYGGQGVARVTKTRRLKLPKRLTKGPIFPKNLPMSRKSQGGEIPWESICRFARPGAP